MFHTERANLNWSTTTRSLHHHVTSSTKEIPTSGDDRCDPPSTFCSRVKMKPDDLQTWDHWKEGWKVETAEEEEHEMDSSSVVFTFRASLPRPLLSLCLLSRSTLSAHQLPRPLYPPASFGSSPPALSVSQQTPELWPPTARRAPLAAF